MNPSEILYLGVKGHVVATSKQDGFILWKTKLKGGFLSASVSFVTLLVEGNQVYAHTSGELFCLDALSGQVLWHNPLDGLGYDLASLAVPGSSAPSTQVVARIRQQQAESNNSASSSQHS